MRLIPFLLVTACTQTTDLRAQDAERKHPGCKVSDITDGAKVTCVQGSRETTSKIKNGERGPRGFTGPKGESGIGFKLPMVWCHHNELSDHKDVTIQITKPEDVVKHLVYPHGFDYPGPCVSECSCDLCLSNFVGLSPHDFNLIASDLEREAFSKGKKTHAEIEQYLLFRLRLHYGPRAFNGGF